jgi:AmmeMemoRadiSam system protein B/AmmeMemoRadiSam system protein A
VASDNGSEKSKIQNPKPVFAGQFYPADKSELKETLIELFDKAEPKKVNNTLAIIAPHAGYVFSGIVAASAYNQIDTGKQYENIFVIASSHREYFNGASIYSVGNCETPYGEVKVNLELAQKLIDENKIFSYVPEAFTAEHSIEVQLPFLQHLLIKEFRIIPIVIGTQSVEECKLIANALSPFFNENNLFVISSDFSHYPRYIDANYLDKITADAIIANDPEQFINVVKSSTNEKVPGLATRACGWTSILTLLYLTEASPKYEYTHISYSNSGESSYGDKEKVVGYNAIALCLVEGKKGDISSFLNQDDKKELLHLARLTLENRISSGKMKQIDNENLSDGLMTHAGAFVTLTKNHQLRGCIGRFDDTEPLYLVVQQMAIASATQDSRFSPVSQNELKELEIEISVLTPMKLIKDINEIVLGTDGIYIKKGYRSGTFLPQVATETGWTLEEYLGHCARDKAGLGWDGWKEAEIYTFKAIVFSEGDFE